MAVVKLSPVTATKADPVTVAVPKVVVKLSPVTRTVLHQKQQRCFE
jgi:hypothetical protein